MCCAGIANTGFIDIYLQCKYCQSFLLAFKNEKGNVILECPKCDYSSKKERNGKKSVPATFKPL